MNDLGDCYPGLYGDQCKECACRYHLTSEGGICESLKRFEGYYIEDPLCRNTALLSRQHRARHLLHRHYHHRGILHIGAVEFSTDHLLWRLYRARDGNGIAGLFDSPAKADSVVTPFWPLTVNRYLK